MKENSKAADTNVGNIKEDIIILEQLIIANENCIKNAKNKDNPFVTVWEKQNIAIEHILSDYKRVLKENEELKQDRNNNYQMIALAQNEVLGYMQGYEDGKKLKRSAVACVVENQQYYIIKKEIEHYKEYIEKLQKENEEYSKQLDLDYVDKNYISKQKIKDEIEELKGKLEDTSRRREKSKTKEEETVLWCLEIRIDERIKTLQELL